MLQVCLIHTLSSGYPRLSNVSAQNTEGALKQYERSLDFEAKEAGYGMLWRYPMFKRSEKPATLSRYHGYLLQTETSYSQNLKQEIGLGCIFQDYT